MSLSVQQLTKVYGSQKAIDGLTFSVSRGEIAGFLGPNGAGKSTTMKILSGVIAPTHGKACLNGLDVTENPVLVKQMLGYLPEHNPLYTDMYVREYLQFVGRLYGLRGSRLRAGVNEMIERCGLTREQHKKIEALSKGYRQRVGLAQALLHNPPVLILDEPTTGLDPNQILEIRQLIREVSRDKTVLFSTHILQEVEALCDRVVVINHGKLVADGTLTSLKTRFAGHTVLRVTFDKPVDEKRLGLLPGVTEIHPVEQNSYRLKVKEGSDIRPEVFRFAADERLTLLEMRQEENTLEELFKSLTLNPGAHVGSSA
ncbi:MAG: gliding motility-associated ABC transporter ATP-binding subunit GldA [Cyclobacteriaceae bacterium]|nr:gliding motility-associated ABC transporter ATP-binding subunit GldA [Cyclobacteriaceae bacterium]MDW8330105.1 gliding motility-associated ABC transporter ATP-binding subunit GldA [Cyclobacteriaceae bacterium]